MDHVRVMTEKEGQRALSEENTQRIIKGMLKNPNQTFATLQCMVMDDKATPADVLQLLGTLRRAKANLDQEDQPPFMLATSGGNHFCEAFHRVTKDYPQLGGPRFHSQGAEVHALSNYISYLLASLLQFLS